MKHYSWEGLSKRWVFPGALVLLGVAMPRPSFADLPRPPGWEPSCTIEKELAKGGGPCEDVHGWQDPDPRQKALADKGYSRRCTEGGAGSYVAVWCLSAAGTAAPTPTPASTSTNASTTTPASPPTVAPAADNRRGSGLCSVQVIGQDKPTSFFAVLVGLLAAAGAARRRSRSRGENR